MKSVVYLRTRETAEPERKVVLYSSESSESDGDTVGQIVSEVNEELKNKVLSIRKSFKRKKKKNRKRLSEIRLKNLQLMTIIASLQSELACKGRKTISFQIIPTSLNFLIFLDSLIEEMKIQLTEARTVSDNCKCNLKSEEQIIKKETFLEYFESDDKTLSAGDIFYTSKYKCL